MPRQAGGSSSGGGGGRGSMLSVTGRLACRAFARGSDEREFVAASLLVAPGKRARDLAVELEISTSTVRRWRRSFAAVLRRSREFDGLRLRDMYAEEATAETPAPGTSGPIAL